jgi:multisubunit Na+/H+ antiporter MnhC subunit
MSLTRFQKITLGIAGVTALSIGSLILATPHAFFASYGIALEDNPSLMSELRAPGAGIATLGAIMLAGVVRSAWSQVALVAALTVYLAFPVGRLVSLAVDGIPSTGVLGALGVEVAIAALCLVAFVRGGQSTGKANRHFTGSQNRYPG